MTPTPPRAVVFDVGNVLVHWVPERVYRELIPDEAERNAFLERANIEAMNSEGDRGTLAAAVMRNAAAHPADAALIRPWWDRWEDMFGPKIEATFDLLERLRGSGVTVCGLTNFAADTWPKACLMHPALSSFDHLVVSGEEGTVKPEPRIYELLEERTGLRGAELFFTDDRAENVDAARERGWRAHLYRGTEGLVGALGGVGIRT